MFQSIPVFEENIFAYKVTGKLKEKDYQEFLPKLTTLIHKYGPISMLFELEDFHGLEGNALREDYEFGKAHDKDFIKIAIVGDKRWEHWMTVLGDILTKTDFRYFDRQDASAAWDWLRNTAEEEVVSSNEENENIAPYRRILATTDFSVHSEKAILRADELAKKYGASLSIIHILNYNDNYDSNYWIMAAPGQYDATDQLLYANTVKHLNGLKEKLGLQDVNSEVLRGTPKTTILSYAEAQKSDLIVMGSHGRRGLSRLIGSTTNGVINYANCEVLSVNIED